MARPLSIGAGIHIATHHVRWGVGDIRHGVEVEFLGLGHIKLHFIESFEEVVLQSNHLIG